jgi:hypothetical protein
MLQILNSEKITKEMAIHELYVSNLSQNETDEFLDIISAINDGQSVYNIITDNGNYLFFIEGEIIKDTRKKL